MARLLVALSLALAAAQPPAPPPPLTFFAAAGPAALALWEGRTALVGAAGDAASFDWPGVRVRFSVFATASVWAEISSPGAVRGLFRVRVDGVNTSGSFFTDNSTLLYELAHGLDAAAPHSVELVSALEPALLHPQPFLPPPAPPYAAPAVMRIGVEKGGQLTAPPPALARRLVFVGDSITCGFGAGGAPPECPNPEVYSEDNDVTYGRLLCARFGAACDIVAWSGKGLYANSPTAGTNETMPEYYRQTLGAGQVPFAATWDFARFAPDAVVVNLGTNDFGRNRSSPAFDANFTSAYVAFLAELAVAHGRPALPVFAASGPLTAKPEPLILAAVAAHNAAGGRAVFLNLTLGHGARGCYGHPSAADHAELAALAAPVIARELAWGAGAAGEGAAQ
jgi:lysophospholipase L1-like esterase